MKTPVFLTIVAVSFAAISLPTAAIAQSTNVRPPNKNQSARFKSVIVKGSGNLIQSNATASFIGGGQSNTITQFASNAIIVGGFENTVQANFGAVGGGLRNTNAGESATIGGGLSNSIPAFADFSTIAGGWENAAIDYYTTVGGGAFNWASGTTSTIGGGAYNTNTGRRSTISGGAFNTIDAAASHATVPGGLNNTVSGEYSFAAGHRAKANHAGCFVWADSTDADFASDSVDSFLIRAKFTGINRTARLSFNEVFGITAPQTDDYGGMYVRTSGAAAKPFYGYSVNGDIDAWTYLDGADGNKWKLNTGGAAGSTRITVTTAGLVGIGTTTPANPLELASGARCTAGGAWVNASDVNSKENFRPVDIRQILARVADLPISKWNYIAEPNVDRIGPMAQDFHAAFGLGSDDKSISTLDSDGVMYAAIKGLVEELKERDVQHAKDLAARDQVMEELKSKLQAVENRLNSLPPAP